jgi:transforming growth factor-beta-induced protein
MVTKIVGLNGAGATKGQFNTLLAVVTAADPSLLDLLSSDATYTLFAPTNSAFAAAGINDQTDKVILNDVLRNHIVAKKVSATNQGSLKTLEGSTLVQDEAMVTDEVGDQAVITASTNVRNGTLHTVDTVLLPYHLARIVDLVQAMNGAGDYQGEFDTLLAAIGAAKATVRDTLGKRLYTLFAPTDEAFAVLGYDAASIKKVDQSLLTDILLYHVASGRLMSSDLGASIKTVQGGTLKYSKGTLTDAVGGQAALTGLDVEGANGAIHIIDAVLMPFAQTRLLDVVAAIAALNRQGSLAGQFDTLLAAADAADAAVLGTLAGKGPYTVFAPSDDAFAAIGLDPNNVGDLDPVYLGDVLLYHAVAGRLSADDIATAQEIKTVQGGLIARDPNDPNHPLHGAYAGAASITTPDIQAFNGLVQVVDAVLLPYEEPAPPPPPAPEPKLMSILDTVATLNAHGGEFDTFLAAVAMADESVLNALSGPAENTLFLPTDDAFAALKPAISSLPQIVVTDILLYHLTPGELTAADVSAAASIPMLTGGDVQQANGVLTDNTGGQAKIVAEDIKASNGVIHVIDAVLLPAGL